METHPDSLVDLRLDAPFPQLLDYALSLDVDAMDSADHGHLPAVVIVLRALEEYKAAHDGKLPALTKDRNVLKQLITKGKRGPDEENFDEALALVIKLAKRSVVPDSIAALFADPACENVTAKSSPFWLLLRALRSFVNDDQSNNPQHLLPLTGTLPDMKATSKGYLNLQTLYRTKAQQDLMAVTTHLHALLTSLSLDTALIPPDEVATFVKHAGFLEIIRGRSWLDELKRASKSPEQIETELTTDEDSLLHWELGFRSVEAFEEQHGRWPGSVAGQEDADEESLKIVAKELLSKYGVSSGEVPDRLVEALQELYGSPYAASRTLTDL